MHAVTLGLAVAGAVVLVSGIGTFSGWALGVLLLGIAFVLRPRFGSLPATGEEPVLYRADAPHLFGLIDEVAAVVGTRGVDAVVIQADANASVSTYGIRQRRVLRLGLGLWEVLTPASASPSSATSWATTPTATPGTARSSTTHCARSPCGSTSCRPSRVRP